MANAKILVLVEVPRGYVFFKSTKRKATEDGIHREEGGPSNLLPWIPASVVMFLIFRFLHFRFHPKTKGKSMGNAPPDGDGRLLICKRKSKTNGRQRKTESTEEGEILQTYYPGFRLPWSCFLFFDSSIFDSTPKSKENQWKTPLPKTGPIQS